MFPIRKGKHIYSCRMVVLFLPFKIVALHHPHEIRSGTETGSWVGCELPSLQYLGVLVDCKILVKFVACKFFGFGLV